MDTSFLFIFIAIVVGFIIITSIRKDKEKKMQDDVNRMIESQDIDGLLKFYTRQTKIQGLLLLVSLALMIYGIYDGKHLFLGLIPFLLFAYRFYISAKEVYELKKIKKEDNAAAAFNTLFWEIIGMLDWSKQGDDDEVIEPAVVRLAQEVDSTIFAFEDMALELTEELQTEENREAQRAVLGRYDKWEFVRTACCIIINGEEYYENCLANGIPEDMWDAEFENLLNIACLAWARKHNKEITEYPRYDKNNDYSDYNRTRDDFENERDYLEWVLSVENRLLEERPDNWQQRICDIHYEASHVSEETGNTSNQAYFLFKLSKNLYEFGDYESAKSFFFDTIELYNRLVKDNEMSSLDKIATCYIHIAMIYNSEKQYDDSMTFANHAIDTYNSLINKYQDGNFIAGLGQCHSIIAGNYQDMGRMNDALVSYEMSISKYEEAALQEPRYHVDVASCYWDISDVYNSLGQKEKAKSCLNHAIQIYEKGSNDNPEFYQECLEQCKEQLKNFDSE